jgi:hypothetical protein
VLARGNGEDGSGGGEEEEGKEVGGLEESEARRSRRRSWEGVPSVVSSELMEAKSEWEMVESGRMKTMVMWVISKTSSVRWISASSTSGHPVDVEW